MLSKRARLKLKADLAYEMAERQLKQVMRRQISEPVREAMTPQQRAKLEEIGNAAGGYYVPHLMSFLTDPIASSLYRKGMVMPQQRDSKGVEIKLTKRGEQVLQSGPGGG